MAFCPECGAKLEDGVKFCQGCGAKISDAQESAAEAAPFERQAQPQTPVQPGTGGVGPVPQYEPAAPQSTPTGFVPVADNMAKKPGAPKNNTKLFIIIGGAVVAVLLIVLVVLFVIPHGGTKGAKGDDPNVGKYIGYQIDLLGWEPIGDVYDAGENYIELKAGGKGTFCLDGEKTAIKWTVDGEALTMTASGQNCTGTLKDGLITTDYFGMDMMMTFLKEGASASPAPAESGASEVGFWVIYEEDENGQPLTAEEKQEQGIYYTIQFNADGTGTSVFDNEADFTWENGELTVPDGEGGTMAFAYTITGDELTLSFDDITMKFHRSSDEVSRPVDDMGTEPGSAVSYADYWGGDWYGWWIVGDAGGAWEEYEGYYTDACALINVYDDDTGYFAAWNETNAAGEAFCTCDVYFREGETDAGCMVSETGSFFSAGNIFYADWMIDPGVSYVSEFDHMIMIHATAVDSGNSDNYMEYYIFLRPWGMTWDDVAAADTTYMPYDDMMPGSYYDWYLPKVEAGVTEAPETFE